MDLPSGDHCGRLSWPVSVSWRGRLPGAVETTQMLCATRFVSMSAVPTEYTTARPSGEICDSPTRCTAIKSSNVMAYLEGVCACKLSREPKRALTTEMCLSLE